MDDVPLYGHMMMRKILRFLRFQRRVNPGALLSVGILPVICIVVLLAGCGRKEPGALARRDKQRMTRVIVILLDAGRYDHFTRVASMAGGFFQTIPRNFSRLVFTRNYSQANETVASVSQLMTGRYYPARYLGYEYVGDWQQLRSRIPGEVTMPEVFAAAGYTTAFFSTHPYLSKDNTRLGSLFQEGHLEINSTTPRLSEQKASFSNVNDVFLPWLNNHHDQRFFAYIHVVDTHFPHSPPIERARRFSPELTERAYTSTIREIALTLRLSAGRERSVVDALYDADMEGAQAEISRILKTLVDQNMAAGTVVVVCADHGDELGERGRVGHLTLDEWTLHTPLVVLVGDRTGGERRVDQLTENIDIFPTLADLCGIDLSRYRIDGRSLATIAEPVGTGSDTGQTAFAVNQNQDARGLHRRDAIIGRRFSLVRYDDESIHFSDIATDPGFDTDLTGRYADLEHQLVTRLATRSDMTFVPLDVPSPISLRYVVRAKDLDKRSLNRVTTDTRAQAAGKWFLDDGFDGNPHISAGPGGVIGDLVLSMPPVPVGKYRMYAEVYPGMAHQTFEIGFAGGTPVRVQAPLRPDLSRELVDVGLFDSDGKAWTCRIRKKEPASAVMICGLVFVPVDAHVTSAALTEMSERLKGLGYIAP